MSDSKIASPSPSGLVEELKRLDKAATPGPWWEDDQIWANGPGDGSYILVCQPESSDADAALIAYLRTHLPQIISCLEAADILRARQAILAATLDQMSEAAERDRKELQHYRDTFDPEPRPASPEE